MVNYGTAMVFLVLLYPEHISLPYLQFLLPDNYLYLNFERIYRKACERHDYGKLIIANSHDSPCSVFKRYPSGRSKFTVVSLITSVLWHQFHQCSAKTGFPICTSFEKYVWLQANNSSRLVNSQLLKQDILFTSCLM